MLAGFRRRSSRLRAAASLAGLVLALTACDPGGESPDKKDEQAVHEQGESEQDGKRHADPYRWLENVEGEKALSWVRERNAESEKRLNGDPRFSAIRKRAEAFYTDEDRIPEGQIRGESVYNFWQDETHLRGLWRRTSLESYKSESPDWEVLLDLDALAEKEGENWVWEGASCLPPAYERCLVRLSRGGADAVVLREFDVSAKAFVEDGFHLEEEKQWAEWVDESRLLVASPNQGGMKNSSGYPRTVRLWRRDQPLSEGETVFTGEKDDAFALPMSVIRPEGRELFILRKPDFFTETLFHLGEDGQLTELPLPEDVDVQGLIQDRLIARLRSDWRAGGARFPAGAVVSAPLGALKAGEPRGVETIVAPDETTAIEEVALAREAVYVALLEDVKGRLKRAVPADTGWRVGDVEVPRTGSVSIASADGYSEGVLINFERFLVPDTLYAAQGGASPEPVKRNPPRFDPDPYTVDQHFTESEDGTRIPYFLIRAKDMRFDGETPTILYGYGGFEIALSPSYLSPLAIEWLERGGAYAVANIRGGGEFGPDWHEAALKENRPKAFADFAAVARDLAEREVTRPERLGIYGGSNGGLLVTASMVRYPERFGSVVAAVPLIDMLRYHKLPAGASWIAEYGNPDIPKQRAYIAAYSPYQNVRAGEDYPPIFLTTSTRDDRVHPGHARKMTAKMREQGHTVVYYENTEGGHSGAANLKQKAERDALITTFFLQTLEPAGAAKETGGRAPAQEEG